MSPTLHVKRDIDLYGVVLNFGNFGLVHSDAFINLDAPILRSPTTLGHFWTFDQASTDFALITAFPNPVTRTASVIKDCGATKPSFMYL